MALYGPEGDKDGRQTEVGCPLSVRTSDDATRLYIRYRSGIFDDVICGRHVGQQMWS